jgi:hypothetical protein
MRDEHTVTFGGEEGALQIGFTTDGAPDGYVRAHSASLRLGPLSADVATLPTLDPRRVHDELRAILESRALTGTVTFGSVEHDFDVRIEVDHGKGRIVTTITTQFAAPGRAEFILTTDQTFLAESVRELAPLLRFAPSDDAD